MVKVMVEAMTGKANGWTWSQFEDAIISWGRAKYGDKYIKGLWRNELMDIRDLDLQLPDQQYDFERLCEMVFDVLSRENSKYADTLWTSPRFWTKKWQLETRQTQREKLFTYLESVCEGEPLRQLKTQGVEKMDSMRAHLYVRFGGGEPEVLNERVRQYLLGMPRTPGKPAMQEDINMEEKLNELETERQWFWDVCPPDQRLTYDPASEQRLTRVVMEHAPKNYDTAIERVKTMIKYRKLAAGDINDNYNHLQRQIDQNFNSDWLPKYVELRAELVDQYNKFVKNKKMSGGTKSTPTMAIGFQQPGTQNLRCYGCGVPGHKRGDAECKADKNAVHPSAPDTWKAKQKGRSSGGKGKGDGRKQWTSEGTCFQWTSGNGYCKFGDNCKFSHDGP